MKPARVSVHFHSVTEKLIPHDTIFAFTNPSDLRDTTLSRACSLYTASASIKSSNDSLPQQGLAGITEDIFEFRGGTAQDEKAQDGIIIGDANVSNLEDSQNLHGKSNGLTSADYTNSRSPSITTQRSLLPHNPNNMDKALPPTPEDLACKKKSPGSVKEYSNYETRPSMDGRGSSQSARPSARHLYSPYEYKPKVKLGPRPSVDFVGRSDAFDSRSYDLRPVSTLPAGLRMPTRKAVLAKSTPWQAQPIHTGIPEKAANRDQHLPNVPLTPRLIPDGKLSVLSNGFPSPARTLKMPELTSPKMTPEKQRLMKALQLRQKQLAARKSANEPGVQRLSTESEFSKPEIDESILSAIVDTSCSSEEASRLEGSPISIPETVEGPSTQASSITDGEETVGRQRLESEAACKIANFESQSLLSKLVPQDIDLSRVDMKHKTSELQEWQDDGKADGLLKRNATDVNQLQLSAKNSSVTLNKDLAQRVHLDQELPTSLLSDQVHSRDGLPMKDPTDICTEELGESMIVLDDQSAENEIQSLEDRIPASDAPAVEAANTDMVRPLLVRRSSLSESIQIPTDVRPHEVPLPPIDEHEEMSLSPRQAAFRELSGPHPTVKAESEPHPVPPPANRQSQDSDLMTERPSTPDLVVQKPAERQEWRHGLINPVKRESSPDQSDEHFLSDDSFMEELKSATVQEAKPVSVSKSPSKPVISRSESEQKPNVAKGTSRSVSSPLNQPHKDGEITKSSQLSTALSSRSLSAAHLHSDPQQAQAPLPKKLGVSSGISQRIKALEQLSGRPASPSSPISPSNPSSFISLRKTSLRVQSTSEPKNNSNNQSRISAVHPSNTHPPPAPSPEVMKSSSFNHVRESESSGPGSVSVTATIVRDANNISPEGLPNPSEPRTMDLHKSPLVVEHQKMGPPPLSPLRPPRLSYARHSSTRSGSTSSSEQKPEPPKALRRDSFASIRSKSSRAGSEVDFPHTLSDSSPGGASGVTSLDGIHEEKKGSRRSRLLKRMSSISSTSKRSIAHALSPGPKEAPILERQEPIHETFSRSVDIGDVNVQFPDTLVRSKHQP